MATSLVDLILPRLCVGCGQPGPALCEQCSGPLEAVAVPLEGVATFAAGRYEDALRAAVIAYKERGRRDLARALADRLAVALEPVLDQADVPVALIPVPSTRSVARARGGQHVLRLARRAAAPAGLAVAPHALRLRRRTLDSAGLRIQERQANLDGALTAARPPLEPSPIAAVVVDDVVTTGATVLEAVRALRAVGWPVIGAAVVAATPRRHPGPADDRPDATEAAEVVHIRRFVSSSSGGEVVGLP